MLTKVSGFVEDPTLEGDIISVAVEGNENPKEVVAAYWKAVKKLKEENSATN